MIGPGQYTPEISRVGEVISGKYSLTLMRISHDLSELINILRERCGTFGSKIGFMWQTKDERIELPVCFRYGEGFKLFHRALET